jgi:GTP-binding protein HflX
VRRVEALPGKERALLAALKLPGTKDYDIEDSLDELTQLARTAGGEVIARVIQEREKPTPAYFIGKGKAVHIHHLCQELNLDLVVFDDNLTPGQQRNLEGIIQRKVIDRTALILDIFAQRAHTSEGKLQVELAQLEYLLPRLVGKGIILSRLGGGIGTRGPGETQLEVDRRRIRKRIAKIKRELEGVRLHRRIYRQKRQSIPLPVISLVGYTNAGKSTLLNALTDADVLVEDKLFATLDPTTRRVRLPNNQTVLVSDTVGFIRKLPHQLVEAFKATLEEVAEADILLHVIDASHPDIEQQVAAVRNILTELGLEKKPTISVLNKIDKIKNKNLIKCLARITGAEVAIAALHQLHIDQLLAKIEQQLDHMLTKISLSLSYDEQSILSLIHRKGRILSSQYLGDKMLIEAEVDFKTAAIIESKLKQ